MFQCNVNPIFFYIFQQKFDKHVVFFVLLAFKMAFLYHNYKKHFIDMHLNSVEIEFSNNY